MIERGLGELRTYLPYNYAVVYAKLFGCSRSKVYKVVKDTLIDFKMLSALKEDAEANLKLSQQISNTNKKLIR